MAYNNIPPHIAGILRSRFIVLPTQLHGHFVPLIFIVTIIVCNTSHLFSFIAFSLNISQMLLGARCYCTEVHTCCTRLFYFPYLSVCNILFISNTFSNRESQSVLKRRRWACVMRTIYTYVLKIKYFIVRENCKIGITIVFDQT